MYICIFTPYYIRGQRQVGPPDLRAKASWTPRPSEILGFRPEGLGPRPFGFRLEGFGLRVSALGFKP